jgi:predicted ATPase
MHVQPKPYLREISLKHDKIADATKYPFTIPAIRHLDLLQFEPDVTFLVGENGTGKSTLLEAVSVALGLNAEGGSQNFNFSTRASHSELHTCLRLVRTRDGYFLRAESFFNVATEIERLDAKEAHDQS